MVIKICKKVSRNTLHSYFWSFILLFPSLTQDRRMERTRQPMLMPYLEWFRAEQWKFKIKRIKIDDNIEESKSWLLFAQKPFLRPTPNKIHVKILWKSIGTWYVNDVCESEMHINAKWTVYNNSKNKSVRIEYNRLQNKLIYKFITNV